MGSALAPFKYLVFDAYPWLIGIGLMLYGRHLLLSRPRWRDRMSGWWSATTASRGTAIGLVALVTIGIVFASANLRFTTVLHGDEPKYLRYCEAFYQGLGFDLTNVRPVSELPVSAPPRTSHTLGLLVDAVGIEAQQIRRDLRLLRHGRTAFNRADYLGNWFLRGKDGGLYQVHNPGLSFVLFPAFALDQLFLSTGGEGNGQFPNSLVFTSLMLLVIYGMWTAAVFDLYVRFFDSQGLAAVMTVGAMLTLPIAALPFQIYPETLAGLLLTLVVRHVLFANRPTRAGSLAAGLAAAALPWMHIRFIAVSILWAGTSLARHRRPANVLFGTSYAIGLALLCAYAYHVTGSLLPTAPYYAGQNIDPLSLGSIPTGLIGELFDRDYGLFAYSPLYLLILPGIIPLFRRDRLHAVLLGSTVLCLMALSAGHSWNAAGGSPLRHSVAVMPLALVAAGETLRQIGRRRAPWVATGLLFFFSLQNAVAYNLHHQKEVGPMLDASISGWKTLLLFPLVFAPQEQTRTVFLFTPLLAIWFVLSAALAFLFLVYKPQRAEAAGSHQWRVEALVVVGLLIVALAGVSVGTATGVYSSSSY